MRCCWMPLGAGYDQSVLLQPILDSQRRDPPVTMCRAILHALGQGSC